MPISAKEESEIEEPSSPPSPLQWMTSTELAASAAPLAGRHEGWKTTTTFELNSEVGKGHVPIKEGRKRRGEKGKCMDAEGRKKKRRSEEEE